MAQNATKYKHSNDNRAETSVIRSPDGVDIKITAGAKWKFARSVMRDPSVTDLQCRVLSVLIDKSNEGYGNDPTLFGYAYLSVPAIAAACGERDVRTIKRVLKELRTGEIVDQRTGNIKEVRKIWLKVVGDGKKGRSAVNRYWLFGWNEFGAQSGLLRKGDPDAGEWVTPVQERVTQMQKKGVTVSPDSPLHPPSLHTSEEHTAANTNDAGLMRERGGPRGPAAPWPEDAFDQWWKLYPNKIAKPYAKTCFSKIEEAGGIEFDTLMEGTRRYVNKKDDRPWCNPSTFINQGRWTDEPPQRDFAAEYKANRKWAI